MHSGEEHHGNQFTSGRFLSALDVCTPICVREHICVHMDHWIYECVCCKMDGRAASPPETADSAEQCNQDKK